MAQTYSSAWFHVATTGQNSRTFGEALTFEEAEELQWDHEHGWSGWRCASSCTLQFPSLDARW